MVVRVLLGSCLRVLNGFLLGCTIYQLDIGDNQLTINILYIVIV